MIREKTNFSFLQLILLSKLPGWSEFVERRQITYAPPNGWTHQSIPTRQLDKDQQKYDPWPIIRYRLCYACNIGKRFIQKFWRNVSFVLYYVCSNPIFLTWKSKVSSQLKTSTNLPSWLPRALTDSVLPVPAGPEII